MSLSYDVTRGTAGVLNKKCEGKLQKDIDRLRKSSSLEKIAVLPTHNLLPSRFVMFGVLPDHGKSERGYRTVCVC